MIRFISILFFVTIFLQSCDDGDIIVTTFNFDDAALKNCGSVGDYVFYKLNPEVKESLSLKLSVTDSLYKTPGTKQYALNGTSFFMNYRNYDGPLGADYFCSSIPPTSPKVTVDYLAQSGIAYVTTTFKPVDNTIRKDVQITVKNVVLVSGQEQIIIETLDMGTIEGVEVIN